jgi:hypothetical protein
LACPISTSPGDQFLAGLDAAGVFAVRELELESERRPAYLGRDTGAGRLETNLPIRSRREQQQATDQDRRESKQKETKGDPDRRSSGSSRRSLFFLPLPKAGFSTRTNVKECCVCTNRCWRGPGESRPLEALRASINTERRGHGAYSRCLGQNWASCGASGEPAVPACPELRGARGHGPRRSRRTAALTQSPRLPLETAMRMRGLEPPRPYGHTDLNRARLPIPPHPRGASLAAYVRGDGAWPSCFVHQSVSRSRNFSWSSPT